MSRMKKIFATGSALGLLASPAMAEEKGEWFVGVSAARTKLVDKGTVFSDGVQDPAAAYETREAFHSIVSAGYFFTDGIAIEASISTPATTNNIPAGSLAGLPNLGDDEFIMSTVGVRAQPFNGPVSPYVGAGLATQMTTQERNGLAVDLNIPSAHGPYVSAGANVKLGQHFDLFVDARKAWYSTHATGLLPLDATGTNFAAIDAFAELDPLTLQIGLAAKFGGQRDANDPDPIRPAENKWIIRAGLTNLELSDEMDLEVGGAPFPNAGLSTFEHQTFSVQAARFLTDSIAFNATLGFPPKISMYGADAIGALPKLGEVRYGPTAFTLQYHPMREGRVRPYIGAGASYMLVFGTEDGAFEDLEVDNDLGLAFEAGFDVMVTNKMGIFFDAKKALLRPNATGTFQGNAVEAETRIDPWALTGGVSFHF